MKLTLNTLFILALSFTLSQCKNATDPEVLQWPEVTKESKPWTRWWWHGSAVTKEGITSELESLKAAGIGGVEITPIFGVKGEEENFINFLEPKWVDMLLHTLEEAERLDLGVDMATGTGWPFGGPWIGAEDAPKNIQYNTYELKEGQRLEEAVIYVQEPLVRAVRGQLTIEDVKEPVSANENLQELAIDQVRFSKELPLVALMAYSDKGEVIELTENVIENKLDWTAPEGNWTLYAVFQGLHGKMVERAAPGGEGNVIDHFSKKALRKYFSKFDSAFAGKDLSTLRAFFNDSYEVDDARGQANWTPGLFQKFEAQHNYDLRDYLPALFGKADDETNRRVLTDYRTTIGSLIDKNFTKEWKKWGESYGKIIRNQAHGSPANILDLYATVDIPETEGTEMQKIKFASSAANVNGKPLSSSESATWLNDHFLSSLADLRKNLERYLLGGINHVFYHGTAYSPDDAEWPGWLFYAAVHVNDRNTIWEDIPKLNGYIARIQSFMQNSKPDNDLLVYFPVYDRYAEPGHGLLEHFDIRGNFYKSQVKVVCDTLLEKGYSYDLISDKQIEQLRSKEGKVTSNGAEYEAIFIPQTEFMPLRTMKKLSELANSGVRVVFHKNLPKSVPGLSDLEIREEKLQKLKETIQEQVLVNSSLDNLLSEIQPESLTEMGLQYIRKKHENGHYYFIVNWGDQSVDGYIPLNKITGNAAIFNPIEEIKGLAESDDSGVYLQLVSGESCIVMTSSKDLEGEVYPYYEEKETQPIGDKWQLEFLKGGPSLPPGQTISTLSSWTDLPGTETAIFSGTVSYTTTFDQPSDAAAYRLDLGTVRESAKVFLNGELLGTLIGPEYQLVIPADKMKETNELRVEVTNLMSNRIIDLENRGVEYRKFYNINFPANKRENRGEDGLFTTAGWKPIPSGLLGPVQLSLLSEKTF